MRKNSIGVVLALFAFLLAGCQTTQMGGTLFSVTPSTETLGQSVQDALINNGDPVIAQVHVETRENVVVLKGYVKKIRQSDTAEYIARHVQGVQNVENNIIVRP